MVLWAVVPLLACSGNPAPETAPRREIYRPAGANTLAPYSPAVRSGDLIFLSGQIGMDPQAGRLAGNIQDETRQALANVRGLLDGMGLDMNDLVKCTVFLADIRDYGGMNEVYREAFPGDPPARSAVGVAGLPAGARVEIECIAAAR